MCVCMYECRNCIPLPYRHLFFQHWTCQLEHIYFIFGMLIYNRLIVKEL